MDDSSYRLNSDLGKKNEIHHYSWKEHLKISKIAKFGREMLQNAENIALQISQILYTFVLRAEVCTTFEPKVVQISARNTKIQNLQGYIFRVLQHFTTKLCNFTNFKMLFLAVVMDFVLPV